VSQLFLKVSVVNVKGDLALAPLLHLCYYMYYYADSHRYYTVNHKKT